MSTPAKKLMSKEALVKRTVSLEEIPVPDKPMVRIAIVSGPIIQYSAGRTAEMRASAHLQTGRGKKGHGYRSLVREMFKKGHKA